MNPPQNFAPLLACEIHGFNTVADLGIQRLFDEAHFRWFRPNEVHAILMNHTYFKIQPQPIDRPESGAVLMFDRKVLRNFRKDGYNWRKKKDGKNVQEAHEKLKIGNEERIHVYYARGEENPNFYRRSYWLLDKNLERIVLVHYRQTLEESALPHPLPMATDPSPDNNRTSPVTPLNSSSGSAHSELPGTAVFPDEINSGEKQSVFTGSDLYPVNDRVPTQNNAFSVDDMYTLRANNLTDAPGVDFGSYREGQQIQYELSNSQENGGSITSQGKRVYSSGIVLVNNNDFDGVGQICDGNFQIVNEQDSSAPLYNNVNSPSLVTDLQSNIVGSNGLSGFIVDGGLENQSSFGRWNCMNDESFGSLDDLQLEFPSLGGEGSGAFTIMDQLSKQEQIFNIMDFSPEWAYTTVETKVLVVGHFNESHKNLSGSKIYVIFGGTCIPTEKVQEGVYRCTILPLSPDKVNFFLSVDGLTPISQTLNFEYRPVPRLQSNGVSYSPKEREDLLQTPVTLIDVNSNSSGEGKDQLKGALSQVHIRLAHLLFSTTNTISILSSKIQPRSLKEAKKYDLHSSPLVEKDWMRLLSGNSGISDIEELFELFVKTKLQDWLLHKIFEGSKITAFDSKGQGVIHLCVILNYRWAVRLFSLSGFSLDFRDAFGWTALHWAAFYGREEMVAALLSAGANPSLVTDPTPENPGGCTACDLASKGGYEGLAAYLAEKGLTAHFQAMSLSGNIVAPPPSTSNDVFIAETVQSENLTEQELCLKDSLAAYRNAADAADRIQAAFRERALKQQTKAVQLLNPVMEATQIVSALKIQHAFRNYSRRRVMKAAAQIQSHFRTWQTRRNFLNMRRQAIRIQAAYRGHQVRRQYHKLIWSVGILEKAILRWRLKRKGLRKVQSEIGQAMRVDNEQEENVAEEEFFRIGREQAEKRINNSVVKVQSMFRSYKAQQEYRRMMLAHEKAKLEFVLDGGVENP